MKLKKSLFCLALLALIISDCKPDKCANAVCQNGGTCNDGTCTCATGYEGDNCETKSTDKFIGTYNVIDNINYTVSINNPDDRDSVFTKTYTVNIQEGNDFGSILIHNVDNNNGNWVYCTVDKSNLTATNRPFYMTINVAHTYNVSATGSISGNSLHITYTVNGYYGNATITSTCTKQ